MDYRRRADAGLTVVIQPKKAFSLSLVATNLLELTHNFHCQVGHALRDRSPLLEQHLSRNLKNLDTLRDEKLCPMSYAEAVTSGEEQDVWRKERYYTLNSENRLRQLWVRPRGFTPGGKLDTRDAASAASCLLKLSAVKKVGKEEVEAAEKKKAEAGGSPNKTLAEKNSTSATSSTLKRKKPAAMTATTAQNTNKASLESGAAPAKKKYIKSVNDIVVPTMQNGSLPIGGNWKFFPLPELQSKIDLGPTDKGWKLKLRPIAFTADTITLNVDPS